MENKEFQIMRNKVHEFFLREDISRYGATDVVTREDVSRYDTTDVTTAVDTLTLLRKYIAELENRLDILAALPSDAPLESKDWWQQMEKIRAIEEKKMKEKESDKEFRYTGKDIIAELYDDDIDTLLEHKDCVRDVLDEAIEDEVKVDEDIKTEVMNTVGLLQAKCGMLEEEKKYVIVEKREVKKQ